MTHVFCYAKTGSSNSTEMVPVKLHNIKAKPFVEKEDRNPFRGVRTLANNDACILAGCVIRVVEARPKMLVV